ncbi:MAG TPA: protein kinase [Kofleriaceae bacterium]|nr:protein kinase [Kofleriaceae bacterium]
MGLERLFADEQLSPDERSRFETDRAAQIVERSRWGVVVGFFLNLALAWFLPRSYPEADFWRAAAPPLAVSATCLVAAVLTTFRWVQVRPGLLIAILGTIIGISIGAAATVTGGFRSPICYALLLLWMFSSAVVPLGLGWFVPSILSEIVIVYLIIEWGTPDPGSHWVPTTMLLGGAAFCSVGCVLRDRANMRAFVAKKRLDELKERLEQRVEEQVVEIVKNAHEVQLLNDQLRLRVQERSRELAEALRQLSRARVSVEVAPGEEIGGRVRIVRRIGEGGMGTVYVAEDLVTHRQVAVKLMRTTAGGDADALRRFVGEAAAAAAISHPGVIKTLHVDVSKDGRVYQIMELVDGPTLEQRMARGGMTEGECARVAAAIADALAAAHAEGVVHRDIKPTNVILCPSPPGIRVLDFGLSKMLAADPNGDLQTAAHQVLGTPAYMSPEQVDDAATVGPASDVYSLGVVLYKMVAGRLPYRGTSVASLMKAHADEPARPLREVAPELSEALAREVHACLEKSPADRPTAAALTRALDALADTLGAPPLDRICERRVEEDATGPTLVHGRSERV